MLPQSQKGFLSVLLLSIFFVVIAAFTIGFFVKGKYLPKKITLANAAVLPSNSPSPSVNQLKIYSSVDAEFGIEYDPEKLSLKEETEEEYSLRVKNDFRKNFSGYVKYQPPKFLQSVYLQTIGVENTDQFDQNPLTVWVFDNSDNLTIESWYSKYWYYPFVWGVFSTKEKGDIAPIKIAFNEKIAYERTITYQPGSPKFIYLSANNKVYLLRIIGDPSILNNFKLK